MAFSAKLAEIKMELFTNNAPRKEMTLTATVERPLSKLAIQGFNVTGQLMSDLSIRSTVTLHSFLIEDTRPLLQSSAISSPTTPGTPNSTLKRLVARPIHHLLYPTESGSHTQQQMLMIDFQQEKQQDSKVDVHLCGFTLILCPSYLLRLLSFFTAGLPKPKSSSSMKAKSSNSTHVATTRSKKPQSISLMSVMVRVDKPDIFLVDRIDRLDTSALVLNFEMKLNLLMLPQAMDISGEVSKLHIYSCLFDPAHRQGTMATVLSPCWLAIKAKLCEDEQASQVDINIGNVTLSVSPGTIALLASVSKSMALTDDDSSSLEEEEEEEAEYRREIALASLANLWEMKPLAFFNFPFLETEVGVEAHELVQVDNLLLTPETHGKPCRSEQMILVFNHFEMMIETGQGNRTSPLVLVESKMNANVKNWSSVLELTASLNLQAGYYNSRLALWEPLLEPVDCTRLGPIRQRPWELTMKMKKVVEDLSDGFEFENRPSSKLEIRFESADTMELTVTQSFLDVVSLLGKAFSDAVNQKLSKRDLLPPSLYMVHNQLDKNVIVSLQDSDFTIDDASITDAKELVCYILNILHYR
jgi:vacuolar protein sorting-associated protein 13A/C